MITAAIIGFVAFAYLHDYVAGGKAKADLAKFRDERATNRGRRARLEQAARTGKDTHS